MTFLCACVLVFHNRTLLGKAHVPYDFDGFHYPLLYYAFRHLRDGVIPLWDPSCYGGMPFIHNVQAAMFYPLHLVYFALLVLVGADFSLHAMQFVSAFHYMVAAAGLFLLLRDLDFPLSFSVAGGLFFAANGFFLAQAQHLGLVETVAWTPMALLLLRRLMRRNEWLTAPLLGLLLAGMYLAGFLPQFAGFAVVFAAYAVWLTVTLGKGRGGALLRLTASLTLFTVLISISTLPTLAYLSHSAPLERHGGVSPEILTTALVPNLFGTFHKQSYWSQRDPTVNYFYCGLLIPLFLPWAFTGRTNGLGFYKFLLAASFLLCFNPAADHLKVPFQSLPLVGVLFRPVSFAPYFAMAAIILALDGLRRVLQAGRWRTALLVLALAVLGTVGYAWWEYHKWTPAAGARSLAVLAAIFAAATFFRTRWRSAVLGIALMELYCAGYGLFFVAYPGKPNIIGRDFVDGGNREIIGLFQSDKDLYRISVDQEHMGGSWDSGYRVWGLESVNGFDPLVNPRYLEFVTKNLVTWRSERTFNLGVHDSPSLAFLNVKYYLSNRELQPTPPGMELITHGFYKVYRYKNFTQRYLVLPRAVKRTGASVSAADLAGASAARVVEYAANRRVLEAAAPAEGAFLFLGEIDYPGWHAYIDGEKTQLLTVNEIFLGINLPPGRHRVSLVFAPECIRRGAYLSLAGLLATAAMIAAAVIRRQRGRVTKRGAAHGNQ